MVRSYSKKVNFQVLDKIAYPVPVQELKLHSFPEEHYFITLHYIALHCITLSFFLYIGCNFVYVL